MKKLPASISQELDLLKQNTLEKLSLPDGSLDDLFSMFVQSQAEVLRLKEELSLMRMRLFGKRSEKQATNEEDPQMRMFDEAEQAVATTTDEEQQVDAEHESVLPEATTSVAAEQPKSQPARGKRKALPAELPRVEVVHELPEHEQHCECGCQKHVIGEETSEQLEIIPQRVQVIRHVRKVYGCKACETAPKTAAKPAQFIEKIMATPSVLSMLLTTKFVDGIPLHRFERVMQRHGLKIPRQTLARWVIESSRQLQPLYNLMQDQLLQSPYIHCDETRVQVLKEPDRSPDNQSWMWVMRSGQPERPILLYEYSSTRNQSVPLRLLEGYQGYLMTDDYAGYNAIAKQAGIERLGCWAHARRKFVDAQKVQPKGKTGRADVALNLIGQLYGVEKHHKTASPEERYQARQEQSLPILHKLKTWLDHTLLHATAKNKLGVALGYLASNWSKLVRYTEAGYLPIDNNPVEGDIRHFAVGRKNWLFSDTPAGADSSAIIYSLMQTAMANGKEPYAWMRYVMEQLPTCQSAEQIEQLLPWNCEPPIYR